VSQVVWSGLEELKAQLRNLPAELAAEASGIVTGRAERARQDIETSYPDVSGNLRKGLRLGSGTNVGRFGASTILKNTAKLAWLYDNGSQLRHWDSGKKTGAMWGKTTPPHTFVKIVIRQRRAMRQDLKALLERHGLVVTGDV
jgi:hypothetical protein